MKHRTTCLLLILVCCASIALAATDPQPTAPAEISAEQAAAIAVNDLSEVGAGYHLRHPRRVVDFTPGGVRIEGRRGAPEWTWTLESVSSSTGRVLVEAGPVAPVAVEATLVRYDRCLLHEDYRLKQGSVEQLLVIPEPLPLEGGDLVVTGSVSCEGNLVEDEGGWRWRGPRGEVTMGRVRVFDADGDPIPARFEVSERATRIVVDGDALLVAAYPVVVDPELGSNDYRISDMGGIGDADFDASDAAVAYNSVYNEYLVVWEGDDNTGGLVDNEAEIFGQLLSATGGGVLTNDFRISDVGGTGNATYGANRPDVAFNSTYNQYLVVWSADDPVDGVVDGELEIWGQVLDADGGGLWDNDFRISSNGGSGNAVYDAESPAVVYNPSRDEYLVVWQGDHNTGGMVDNEYEIWAQRVYSTGILIGANERMSDMGGTGDALFNAFQPDVVYNSGDFEYLIVWYGDDNAGGLVDDEFEIYGQRTDEDLVGVGANDARVSDMGGTGDLLYDAFHPSVAYNSVRNEYLVVWQGDDNVGGLVDAEFEVFSQRMDADMGGLGGNDFRLSDVGGVGNPDYDVWWGPEVAYSPILDQYMVVWGGEDDLGGMVDGEWEIFAQMLNGKVTDGIGPNDERISDAGGIGELSFTTYSPVVAANTWNGQFLVAWHGDDNGGSLVQGEYEIFIQRMDGMALFVDRFESGDTSAWSLTVP
jgi:hypothetical protein